MPSWIGIALACAFLTGSTDALAKTLLAKSEERVVAWAKLLFALPFLLPLPFFLGWPSLSGSFWLMVAVMVPMELTAYLCYLRAIRTAPLSLVIPFLAFTPLLTVLTGWVFLGERIPWLGFLGVLAVTIGAYVLQSELAVHGLLEPIKAMLNVPGIRLMILTAALYGMTATLGKRAIQLSSAAAFPFLYLSIDTLMLTPLAWRGARTCGGFVAVVKPHLWLYLLSGLVSAASILTHCFGILLAPVAYFIAIKRLSLLVSVLYGGLLFGEPSFLQRVLGTTSMLAGAALITLAP